MTVLDCGCGESFKRGYHAAIAVLFVGAALYNAASWCKRPSRQLALMTGLYVAGVAGEAYVCTQHRTEATNTASQRRRDVETQILRGLGGR